MIQSLVITSVFAPLLAALFTFSFRKYAYTSALAITSLIAFVSIALIFRLFEQEPVLIALGGWLSPLGIQWRIDGFMALMLLVTNIIAVAITVYAKSYFTSTQQSANFWPLWMMLLAGLNALFLSNDLFNWYITLEIIGLSAVALVILASSITAYQAAFRYLLVSLVGSLCFLAGVALLYRTYGALDLSILKDLVVSNTTTTIAISLIMGGLLLKSAIFPLHFWLAPAHSSAPAPVSALLSALVVKGAFYIIIQIWLTIVPASAIDIMSIALSILGIFAIIWGSYCALRTKRLKLLVAYSTVAQLGYLTLFFPLSADSKITSIALGGIGYFIVAHALAKAALFLAAGNLQKLAGHDELSRLGPAAAQLPMTLFACALAGASIMGLPPSGGFIAKWTLLNAAFVSEQWPLVVVIASGGLLSVAYIFRILKLAFQNYPEQGRIENSKVTASMQWVPLGLAGAAVALGLNAIPTLDLLQISLPYSSAIVGDRP